MKRDIITIDEDKCTGCGLCATGCPEGALQMIDGKARLVGDLYCDGLGACIGDCPEGAITVERREAEPYDEQRVMDNVIKQGDGVIQAHLAHLRDHGEMGYYNEALNYLSEHGYDTPAHHTHEEAGGCSGGCPGTLARIFEDAAEGTGASAAGEPEGRPETRQGQPSELDHWPIQMHLMNPASGQYTGADFLLASDCSAFCAGDFHLRFLRGKKLGIACPKLDTRRESYEEKLTALIDEARINTLTVLVMEVPCCSGLIVLAKNAAAKAARKVPIKKIVLSAEGKVLSEEWV